MESDQIKTYFQIHFIFLLKSPLSQDHHHQNTALLAKNPAKAAMPHRRKSQGHFGQNLKPHRHKTTLSHVAQRQATNYGPQVAAKAHCTATYICPVEEHARPDVSPLYRTLTRLTSQESRSPTSASCPLFGTNHRHALLAPKNSVLEPLKTPHLLGSVSTHISLGTRSNQCIISSYIEVSYPLGLLPRYP